MATFTKPPFFNSRKLLSVNLVLDFRQLKLSVNLGVYQYNTYLQLHYAGHRRV